MSTEGDDEDAQATSDEEMRQFAERVKLLREQAYILWKDQRLAGTRIEAHEFLRERGFEGSFSIFNAYEGAKRRASPGSARQLIDAYNVPGATVPWLLHGGNEPEWGKATDLAPVGPRPRFIPRLTPKEAAKMPSIYQSLVQKREILHPVLSTKERSFGQLSFLFPIVDDSMTPSSPYEVHRFPKGDWVIIDDIPHELGDFVCVVLSGSDEAVLRQYREISTASGGRAYGLAPLNTNYAIEVISADNPVDIKGVMIEHIRNYRR